MKLAIGTAQFGLDYGVANNSGQVSPDIVREILTKAAKVGIDTLDTAIAYGNSENCLGDVGINDWRIVTKLPALPEALTDVKGWVFEQVESSLHRLRIPRLEAVLLHRPSDLLGQHSNAYLAALTALKSQGLAKATGVSIYAPAELDALWSVVKPDMVQAPLNVLDRRLIRSGWLKRLSDSGVRVHTRSTFLQGLLLLEKEKRPEYFKPWSTLLDMWLQWCEANQCSSLEGALAYLSAQDGIECVVVGVDSDRHLDEIHAASNKRLPQPPAELSTEDTRLINPSFWKLT